MSGEAHSVPASDAEPHRPPGANRRVSPSWHRAVPVWIGRVAQAAAVFLILTMIPRIALSDEAFAVASYLDTAWLTPFPSLFNAGVLLVVGHAAIRRKRSALWMLICLAVPGTATGLCIIASWLPDIAAGEIGFEYDDIKFLLVYIVLCVGSAALLVLLIVCRRAFTSAMVPASHRSALIALTTGFVGAIVVGWVLTESPTDMFASTSDRWWWIVHSVIGSTPNQIFLDNIDALPPLYVTWITTSISGAGIFAALYLATRSRRDWLRMDADDELDLRRLLATRPSEDSLAYFATRRDKAVTFTADRDAAVAYAVVGSVALASGDPLGPPSAWPAAIAQWQRTAHSFGWVTAVVAATERGARAYRDAGMTTTILGDEAIIDTDSFHLAAPAMRGVRAAVRRTRSAGCTVSIDRLGDLPPDDLHTLGQLVDTWRTGEERGFSMALGRFGDPTDGRYVVVVARSSAGEPIGILGFAPWGPDGLSLDVMRRSPDAVNGVTELMVATVAGAGPELRVRRLSLNFAMFRETLERGERIGASRSDRLRRRVVLFLSRFWQLDSLYRSNAKYQPQWRPRMLCHEAGLSQASALLATARAEGFMTWPFGLHQPPGVPRGLAPDAHDDFVAACAQADQQRPVHAAAHPCTDQQRSRISNLQRLREAGVDPYPVTVDRDTTVPDLRARFVDLAPGARTGQRVAVVGRLVGRRDHGGVLFLDLREANDEVQVRLERSTTSRFSLLARRVDLGDLLSVTGEVVSTPRGTLTIDATSWSLAAKSLDAPPARHTGLLDADSRLRMRHIEIATRAEARDMLVARSHAVGALRSELLAREFLEVETPILQTIHGGANARPFRTHINAYDADLSLRIAPELALKRLVIGGMPRVFEIGRNFRNEGADATHNPEFTAIEAYQAFADYTDMRVMARELIVSMARAVHGDAVARRPDGDLVRLDGDWPVVTVHDAVSAATGQAIRPDTGTDELRAICAQHGLHTRADVTNGELVAELYDRLVEPSTVGPTFYIDFPVETSPLTRVHRRDPRLAERWDLVAFGAELGTAYTELNDPVDQRARFTAQSLLAACGDPDAMELDESFLKALEFGMPPTGGIGLGVDRIVMMLTGTSIRQTLAFPFVRPATTI